MWDKFFCSVLFLNIYNQLFWLESGLPDGGDESSQNLEIDLENLVEEDVLPLDKNAILEQINFWQKNQVEIINDLSKFTTNWEKTLITTKAVLICAYLEIKNLDSETILKIKDQTKKDEENSTETLSENSKENLEVKEKTVVSILISKYLKIAQGYVDNKNVSLIHAILTHLFENITEVID